MDRSGTPTKPPQSGHRPNRQTSKRFAASTAIPRPTSHASFSQAASRTSATPAASSTGDSTASCFSVIRGYFICTASERLFFPFYHMLLPEGMGKNAKAVSGFSIDPAFHPYYGREDATMKPMTQAVAIAAGMAGGDAVAATVPPAPPKGS